MTSVFPMSIMSEKKCTLQVLSWPHHSYSGEILFLCTYLNMSWRGHTGFLKSLNRTGPNHDMLCPCFTEEVKTTLLLALTLLCFYQAVGSFTGYSDICTISPESALLHCIYTTTLLPGCCLGQPMEGLLFDHWWVNQSLSLPSASAGHFFTLFLGTLQEKLFNSSWYFQFAEVTNLQATVVYMHSPSLFQADFSESIPKSTDHQEFTLYMKRVSAPSWIVEEISKIILKNLGSQLQDHWAIQRDMGWI